MVTTGVDTSTDSRMGYLQGPRDVRRNLFSHSAYPLEFLLPSTGNVSELWTATTRAEAALEDAIGLSGKNEAEPWDSVSTTLDSGPQILFCTSESHGGH